MRLYVERLFYLSSRLGIKQENYWLIKAPTLGKILPMSQAVEHLMPERQETPQ